MKKLLLFAAVAIFTTSITSAQEVKIGAKAGVNFASLGGDDLGDVKGRTSFHIGGLVEIPLSEKFSIQPEVLYSGQGFRYEESSSFGDFKETFKFDYINVPVMAKYYVVDGLSFEAGPQVGILASAKFEEEFDGETDEGDLEDVSTIDLGIGAGVAYRLPMGLFFSARYTLGLSNTNDGDFSDEFKTQNNVIQISTGFVF